MPVTIFAYCYGRIFYVIRRHNKEVSPSQGAVVETMPPAQNTDQVQQQETEGAPGALTRIELSVLQTMIIVIAFFLLCWTPSSLAVIVQTIMVCQVWYM